MPPEQDTLARLQADFGWNALAPGAAPPPALEAAIRPAGVPAARRLAIHRNHFATTLVEALGGVFEATRALLGADYFDGFALRFARAAPPAGPCLFEYGADLPAALAAAPELADHGYAADVARLEWAMHESFHAPAAALLQPATLGAVPADRVADARLALHPTLRLVLAPFPVDALWRGARAGEVAPEMLTGPSVRLLLLRPEVDVRMERIDIGMYSLLCEIAAGAALGAAAQPAAASLDAFDFGETLGECLRQGVFAGDIRFG